MSDKKELLKQYKQTPRPMGVLIIKNKLNNKCFIETALDLPGKINSNKFQLKNNLHFCKELQADFNAQSETDFSFEVLDYLKPGDDLKADYKEELKVLEDIWLEKLQPFGEKGYHRKK